MNKKRLDFQTMTIHGGTEGKNAHNALNPPIYQTSTFVFDDLEHVEKVMSFESDDYVYTRGNNPTLRQFENRMTELEEGKGAVAFSSGMAAISSVLFSLTKPGDNIILNKTLYGSSYNVATKLLPEYNVDYKIADLNNTDVLYDLIDEDTKVIYFETPSNPNLMIIDVEKVVEIAREKGVKVVVDNTFATPYFQRPLTMGVDVVVHSATKYICGHGDSLGGIAVSRDKDYIRRLKFDYMCEFGGVLSPNNAWLMLRGLKTLALRMREHEKNAKKTAKFLAEHKKIKDVFYPGLKDFDGYETAKKQMDGFGAIIAFEIDGDFEDAKKFINAVELAQLAVSLGDCETLIELPAAMTHYSYPEEKLIQFGLTKNMIRISIGLEHYQDIIDDLDNALKQI